MTIMDSTHDTVEPSTDSCLQLVGPGRLNRSVMVYAVVVDGYRVPYVEVSSWPATADGAQVYRPLSRWTADGNTFLPEDFEPIIMWTVTLDDRLAFDFPDRAAVENAMPMLADGMAIAAGWTAHGVGYRRNPHGPSLAPVPHADLPAAIGEIPPTGD